MVEFVWSYLNSHTQKLVSTVGGRLPETIRLSSYHNVQTEETLNPDISTIPLITILESTDNFSEASKLGEGGFGPVYKVHRLGIYGIDFYF